MPFVKTLNDGTKEFEVRAFLAALFAGALVGGFFMKLVSHDAFLGISTMSIAYYFSKRSDEDKTTKPPVV